MQARSFADTHRPMISGAIAQKRERGTKSVSGWVWGNILFGGLIGLAVDAITGGLYNLSPEQLNAELKKQGKSFMQKEGGIYLVTVLRPDPTWQKIGELKSTK